MRRLSNAELLTKYQGRKLMDLSPADRIEFLSHAPGISAIEKNHPKCEGWMSKTALKHIYGTDEQRAKKPVCSFKARWKYEPIADPRDENGDETHASEGGNFCWHHLWSRGIYGSMPDEGRYNDWLIEVGLRKK
jgi:hypothetical protein